VTWATETRIYVNGSVDAFSPLCSSPAVDGDAWVYFKPWGAWYLGYADELHVSRIARSEEVIASRVVTAEPVPGLSAFGLVAAAAALLTAHLLVSRSRRRRVASDLQWRYVAWGYVRRGLAVPESRGRGPTCHLHSVGGIVAGRSLWQHNLPSRTT